MFIRSIVASSLNNCYIKILEKKSDINFWDWSLFAARGEGKGRGGGGEGRFGGF